MKITKVLKTCDLFPPDFFGGTEHHVYKQTRVLKEHNYEITLICKGDPHHKEFDGITTIRSNIQRYYFANILLFPKIFKYTRKADIIHNHTFDTALSSIIVAKVLKKPSIMTVHGVYGPNWIEMRKSYIRGNLRYFFEKLQMRLPYDKVLFTQCCPRSDGRRMRQKTQEGRYLECVQ